jgi:hypothetical protein
VWVLLALDPDPPYQPVDVLAVVLAAAAASGLLRRQVAPLAAMAVTISQEFSRRKLSRIVRLVCEVKLP